MTPFATLTARQIIGLAGAGSALTLGAAFAFQWGGYPPCELCILQRWPHVVAVLLAAAAGLMRGRSPRLFAALGVVAMLACAAVAFYHAGVEFHWWPGPAQCSGGAEAIAGLSVDELMKKIKDAPVVRCDQPALLIFGLSMAVWNVILSLVLARVWAVAWRRA